MSGAAGAERAGSGMAVTAFVLALLSWVCLGPLTAIPALILGIMALVRSSETPPHASGKGLAIASIVIGAIGLLSWIVVIPLMIGVLLPSLEQARASAQSLRSSANIRQMCQGLTMLATENGELFPESADGWQQALIDSGLVPAEAFTSPYSDGIGSDYFYVPGAQNDFDSMGVLLYEDPALDPEWTLICFRDCHVERVRQDEALRILSGLTLPDGTPYAPHLAESGGVSMP